MHRLALHDGGRLELQGATTVGGDLAETVDGLAQRVHDAAEVAVAHGHGQHLAGALDLLALLDAGEVTQDDDTDLADVEVQREAERAVLELEQLVGHGRGQTLDARDAVRRLGDDADLFGLAGARGVLGDELLQRVADLLGTDGEFRHVSACLLWVWWLGGAGRNGVGQPASRRRAASSRLDMVPSTTSPPRETAMPPTTLGSTTTLRCTSRPYLAARAEASRVRSSSERS